MEHHGNNPLQKVVAIIPARYSSTRLPGKLMLEIAGKPLIYHTIKQAKLVNGIDGVIVATDDERLSAAARECGIEAVMTSPDHTSGTDRVAEAAGGFAAETIVVNIQADEPLISPNAIAEAIDTMKNDPSADIVTTCEPIFSAGDVLDPDVVKVVTDLKGYALYFSRSPIPYLRDESRLHGSLANALAANQSLIKRFRKHTGLYLYRNRYLRSLTLLNRTDLEKFEMLEQLRALQNGARIRVVETAAGSIGVDTAEDLERVREILEAQAV